MALDDTLIALADPTRRTILQRLSRGEARVTDVAAPFDISLNSVSKHIRILERAELVRRRVTGRDHFLSFNAEPLAEAAEWIERSRAFWTGRLDALEAALRAEDAIDAAKKAPSPRPKTRKPRSKK
jgi:DNA-binding transcriptional ArsR family regulator